MRYVLITAARNEAAFIEQTIQSVTAQTVLPLKWVIVSDGSTDDTDRIVQFYASQHSWIELLRMPERRERHFAGKVHAFNAGLERVAGLPYDVVGNLDADLTFGAQHYASLLHELAADPKLGLVGPALIENGQPIYDYRFTSARGVMGANQTFRRACFEQIGGYVPMKTGGIDLLAVLQARAAGWETRTLQAVTAVHHRRMGSAEANHFRAGVNQGRKDYLLGSHPGWEICRVFYQMSRPPRIWGGLAIGWGYFSSVLRRLPRPIPSSVMAFRRREEIVRLKRFIFNH